MIFFVVPIFGKCSKPAEISKKIRNILPAKDFIIIFVDDNPQKNLSRKEEYKSNIGECSFFIKSGGVGQHKAIIYGISYIIQNFWELISLSLNKDASDSPKLEDSIFIVMDGDLSYDIDYIPIFLDKLRDSYLVLGISDKNYGLIRKIPTSLFYYLIYRIILAFSYFHKGKLNSIPDWIFEPQNLSRLTTFVAFKPKLLTCFNLNAKNFLVHLIFSAIKNKAKIDFVVLKKNFESCSSYTFPKLIKLSFETILDIISVFRKL